MPFIAEDLRSVKPAKPELDVSKPVKGKLSVFLGSCCLPIADKQKMIQVTDMPIE
jgi:hypothetical protein